MVSCRASRHIIHIACPVWFRWSYSPTPVEVSYVGNSKANLLKPCSADYLLKTAYISICMSSVLFVDGQNLFHGARKYGEDNGSNGYRVDACELLDLLSEDYDIIRSFWFDSFNPENNTKVNFFHMLENNGYKLEKYPLRRRGDSWREKGVDVALVTKFIVLGMRDIYDTAILITGDEDYGNAIEEMQDQGKTVVIASFEKNLSGDMRRRADSTIILDEYADRIQL